MGKSKLTDYLQEIIDTVHYYDEDYFKTKEREEEKIETNGGIELY